MGPQLLAKSAKAPGPRTIQLLHLTQDSYRVDTEEFLKVMDQVPDLPIAIISMNGSCREGKSYVLNYFIRYFKSQQQQHSKTTTTTSWLSGEPTEDLFLWRSGRERETMGINVWSEPFIFPRGGHSNSTAVFLLDCQGLFDDQTTFQQNAMIYALSNLLSSVMIYNVKCKIEENLLQNIQYFSSYAKALVSDEESYCGDELPHFVFLVRDFEFITEYQYGFHSQRTFPHLNLDQPRNYFEDTFSTPVGMPAENQALRNDILGSYSDVSTFLMPFPGKKFVEDSKKYQPDQDFQEFLQKFIQLMTSSPHLVTKKIGGMEVTGKELKSYIQWWSAECEKSTSKFPDVRTIAESTLLLQNEVAASNAFSAYKQHFSNYFLSSSAGVPDASLHDFHRKLVDSVCQYYEVSRKLGDASVIASYKEKIKQLCDDAYSHNYFPINAEMRARRLLADTLSQDALKLGKRISQLEIDLEFSSSRDDPELLKQELRRSTLKRQELECRRSREITILESQVQAALPQLRKQGEYFKHVVESQTLRVGRVRLSRDLVENRLFKAQQLKASEPVAPRLTASDGGSPVGALGVKKEQGNSGASNGRRLETVKDEDSLNRQGNMITALKEQLQDQSKKEPVMQRWRFWGP